MFEERFAQIGAISNAGSSASSLSFYGFQVFTHVIGHVRPKQFAPEVLYGVEFGCVRREILDCEPLRLFSSVRLNITTTMHRQTVPQQNCVLTLYCAFQCARVGDYLGAA